MNHAILKNIRSFKNKSTPCLMALSGGVDSMLLYDLLINEGFSNLHVVHVDHNWSEGSTDIAAYLRGLAKANSHPFYLHTIKHISIQDKNVEDLCREQRLRFFKRIYKKIEAKAIFLAHHADDQVEVVLKRIFEGAYITNCTGMKKEIFNFDMNILRPFLGVKKKDILQLARTRELHFFEDASNQNLRFLRARFREKLLVDLQETFQKPIKNSVLQVSHELNEIQEFLELDFKNNSYRLKKTELGQSYKTESLSNAQIRFAVKKIIKNLGDVINREQMRILMESIAKNRSNNRCILSKYVVVYKKKCLNFNLINR